MREVKHERFAADTKVEAIDIDGGCCSMCDKPGSSFLVLPCNYDVAFEICLPCLEVLREFALQSET